MNCDSVLTGGDRRRHRDARSARVGEWELGGTRRTSLTVGCRDTWSRSAGRRRRELDQPRLANSRGHEATELSIRRARSGANPAIGGHFERFSSDPPTAMPVPAVSDRGSGEQDSTRQPTSRCRSARLSLCVNQPSEEQDSTRRVRFWAGNIAHQCSEEEPLAETENHRH